MRVWLTFNSTYTQINNIEQFKLSFVKFVIYGEIKNYNRVEKLKVLVREQRIVNSEYFEYFSLYWAPELVIIGTDIVWQNTTSLL